MSCADSGGGMPGSSPRRATCGATVGDTVCTAVDDGTGVAFVLMRWVWSSCALHAVSSMTAAPRLVRRRRIESSLRDAISHAARGALLSAHRAGARGPPAATVL